MKILKRLFIALGLIFIVPLIGLIELSVYAIRWILTGKKFPYRYIVWGFLPD